MRGGSDFSFYTPAMRVHAVQRLSLEAELLRAVENQEFVVYYQPMIESRSGRLVGVEALGRWNNPTSGIIEPDAFLPTAEAKGLIIPIGAWVLKSACAQAQTWPGTLWPDLRVCVNVSARQLRQTVLAAPSARTAGAYTTRGGNRRDEPPDAGRIPLKYVP